MRAYSIQKNVFALTLSVVFISASYAGGITNTAFTYQGQLKQAGVPVSETCDFEFSLWNGDNDPTPGSEVATTIPLTTEVGNGLFKVELDFGSAVFSGSPRWLEIKVCCSSPCSPTFVTLTPRQPMTATPYAIHTRGIFVDDAGNVGIGTKDPRVDVEIAPLGENADLQLRAGTAGGTLSTGWNLAAHGADGSFRIGQHNGSEFTDWLTIDSNGRVGIRKTDPEVPLDVAGRIQANGLIESKFQGFKFPDATIQTTAAVPDGDTLAALSCTNGQIAKWFGASWGCAFDDSGAGGASTLDEAYDGGGAGAGRIITADSGAVQIDGSGGLIVASTIQSGSSIVIDGNADTITASSGTLSFGDENLVTKGNIGVGTPIPAYPLQVISEGLITINARNTDATGFTYGVWAQSDSINGRGVLGITSSTSGVSFGVEGVSNSTSGTGVSGTATNVSGNTIGVEGVSSSLDGTGVIGLHEASSGTAPGVLGESHSSSVGAIGVHGLLSSTAPLPTSAAVRGENRGINGNGYGVWGSHDGGGIGVRGTTNDGRAVHGIASGPNGRGVVGEAQGSSGFGFGLYGLNVSPNGYAVYGTNNTTTGTTAGVYGQTWSTSASAVGVHGVITSTTPGGFSAAVRGENMGTGGSGIGVWGSHGGSGWGVHGTTSGGRGVFGLANATTGANEGVRGQSDSTSGKGVFGLAGAASGFTYGVWGLSASTDGRGVFGQATATSGSTFGVRGESSSTDGRGVFGWALSTSGETIGVWGQSESTHGIGVLGRTTNTGGQAIGVMGESSSTTGTGVAGIASKVTSSPTTGVGGSSNSTTGKGVAGNARADTGVNYGVWGRSASNDGFDFFAAGTNSNNYGAISSRRWKSNVRNIDKPLDKIARLRGVYFDWDIEHGGQHDVGMIAEEVGKVLPEIVNYEENGIDAAGMDYSKIAPLLVEAVNALRSEKDAQIAELRRENAAIIARLQVMEARLGELTVHSTGGTK